MIAKNCEVCGGEMAREWMEVWKCKDCRYRIAWVTWRDEYDS